MGVAIDGLVVLAADRLEHKVLGLPGLLGLTDGVAPGVPVLVAVLGGPEACEKEVIVLAPRPEGSPRSLVAVTPLHAT